jgi:hypothetical protein
VCAEEKSDIGRGIYGTGAHSDYGLLTLLATDDVPDPTKFVYVFFNIH